MFLLDWKGSCSSIIADKLVSWSAIVEEAEEAEQETNFRIALPNLVMSVRRRGGGPALEIYTTVISDAG
jgi:deoxyhypusine synthase